MFKNAYQKDGLLTILHSLGSQPLKGWETNVKQGHIKRLTDCDLQSLVLELQGENITNNYIALPPVNKSKQTLGITNKFLVLIIKNVDKYFSFEVTVLDDKGIQRKFRASNFQSNTRITEYICSMPVRLDSGWNQINFNLADFVRRAYGTKYVECQRVVVHATCRIRRIYFAHKLWNEEELPEEYRIYRPLRPPPKFAE